jgi:YHS domain-containing protein
MSRMTVPQLGPTIQFSHSGRLVENSRQQIPVHNHSCSKVTQTDGIVSFPILHGPSAGPARHNGGVMPKTYVLLVLAVVLAAPAAAVAGPGEYQSLDAMGLASGKGMKTPCKVSGDYEGKTYCFRSEDAKAEFMKDAAAIGRRQTLITAANQAIRTGRRAITLNRPISPTAVISC